MKQEVILKLMHIAIEGYCFWEKYKSKKMILISVSNQLGHFKFAYKKDIVPFSKTDEESIQRDLKSLNWFQNLEDVVFNIQEYPDE